MSPGLGPTVASGVKNAFDFNWMFDFLSLGTTYLYRKYMIGATLAAEEHVWRRPCSGIAAGATIMAINFDRFDEAYPDIVPYERLRRRRRRMDTVYGSSSDDVKKNRRARNQVRPA
jgi:hypothetical protein